MSALFRAALRGLVGATLVLTALAPSAHAAQTLEQVQAKVQQLEEDATSAAEGAQEAKRDKLAQLMKDITDYHTSPVQAAEIAHQSQVPFLLLNHIAPPLPLPGLVDIFLKGTADVFKGKIQVAKDGDVLSLPAGQKVIQTSKRF